MHEYFKEMWNRWRRDEAQAIPYEFWSGARAAKCHENAAAYVRMNPSTKTIHGALVQPIDKSECCLFFAHSVVELSTGERIDITPLAEILADDTRQRGSLRFLEHLGSDEQFQRFRDKISSIIWPPAAPDLIRHAGDDPDARPLI